MKPEGQGLPVAAGAAGLRLQLSITVVLWLFALGVAQVALWPRLPALATGVWVGIPGLVLLGLVVRGTCGLKGGIFRVCLWLLPFALGTGWALYWDRLALDDRLPENLHNIDAEVTLQVTSLPELKPSAFRYGRARESSAGAHDIRFSARIDSAVNPLLHGKTVLLAWYGADESERLGAGSRWRMQLRLKQPRGSVNPHTFDYEAWLLQQGYFATGYVRDGEVHPRLIEPGSGLYRLRDDIRNQINASGLASARLLRALLLGDKSGLTDTDRKLLRETGTAHLLAISGLHVGMVAGFFLFWGGLVARVTGLYRPHNPRLLAGIAAIAAATGYTLVCGAPLSAQRALLMTVVAIGAWVWRRRVSAGLAYACALALVLLLQPLAVLNAGFWLSFFAVAALLLGFAGRLPVASGQVAGVPRLSLARRYLLATLRSQWLILLALLLPSLIFFAGVSRSGLLLNLIAIPWLGLFILPAILMGTLLPAASLGAACWQFADWQLGLLLNFLAWSQDYFPDWQWLSPPDWTVVILGFGSVLLLLLPRGFPGKLLGWCLLPVVFAGSLPWRALPPAALQVTVLDVGQGLAVAVEADGQFMVLDTGAGMPAGWSAGRSVVAPYLLGQGATSVNALVVSHGDRDHAGGVEGLAESLPVSQIVAPGNLSIRLARQLPQAPVIGSCVLGEHLQLRDLRVSWLWPPAGARVNGEENDHSCVALLQWRGARVLFTGDISHKVERQLVKLYPDFAPVDLLIVPHHGSRTSTSTALLDWSHPGRAVFSAGFRHHFGHPHPSVVQRLSDRGVTVFNTADTGAVQFQWLPESDTPEVRCARDAGMFWRSSGTGADCG